MHTIRVVIAENNSLTRSLLRALLEVEEGIEVVGEATNGRQAVELALKLRPNVITMDLEMPVMSGLEAIKEIMHSKAVPILVVSNVADASHALEAMEMGALEIIAKPDVTSREANHFVHLVRLLAGVSVITRMRPSRRGTALATSQTCAAPMDLPPLLPQPPVFAIASSTGGPQALARILPSLPETFLSPVLVAQHISDGFALGIVNWLGTLCRLPVRLAAEGETLQGGVIYISPSEFHLTITPKRRFALLPPQATDIYHPSCDLLLNSVAEVFGQRAIGIILTGMGSDGTQGMARIREKGGITLSQDEESSTIFGMNHIAIESGAVQKILPVEAIAAEMTRLAAAFVPSGRP